MIDLNNCKNLFQNYTKKYDLKNEKILLKVLHTYRVMDNCIDIAKSLDLKHEDLSIAALIGLLHDIGRFEQIKQYNTFNDHKSVDHAALGVDILKKDKFISKFVSDKKTQEIVFKTINNHNKYEIEYDLDDRTLMFCKIIRDADKLDIFKIFSEKIYKIPYTNSCVSNRVLNYYLKGIVLPDSFNETVLDENLRTFGMLYDLNYEYSINKVISDNIPDKLMDIIIKSSVHEKENLLNIKKVYYKKRGNLC